MADFEGLAEQEQAQKEIKVVDFFRMDAREMARFIRGATPDERRQVIETAARLRDAHYGHRVFVRGLIEITNHCARDCYYCGLRRSNRNVQRYRLSTEEILECCRTGADLGLKTFVLQGGEDSYYNDERLSGLVSTVRRSFPDCAITLSLGERSKESYRMLKEAGADRYLLRHETANQLHYTQLHPPGQNLIARMECLQTLKALGFQTGAGFMVGSPHQTDLCLAQDLFFLKDFQPHMVGVGPFLPHGDTPFAHMRPGDMNKTVLLIALTRIFCPMALMPATTAMSVQDGDGRLRALDAGANVVMPNLTPKRQREHYAIYDQKDRAALESRELFNKLVDSISGYGYDVDLSRGDAVGAGV